MNKKTVFTTLLALVIGMGLGYVIKPSVALINPTPQSTPVSTMHQTMTDMTESLKGKTGAALETTFLEGMITHHEGAVAMAQELQKGTKRPELLKMANDIISAQTSEITMMKKWLNQWFGR